jgi:hypothetical protein
MPAEMITIAGKQYRPLTTGERDLLQAELVQRQCWDLVLIDQKGKVRKAFMRGPETENDVIAQCKIAFANWKLVEIHASAECNPPPNAKAIPSEAFEFGVLQRLNDIRRR